MKVLQVLFLFVLIVFPFGELLRYQTESGFGITALDITVIATTLWFFFYCLFTKSFPKTPLYKAGGIFVGAGILSLVVNIPNYTGFELFISSLYLIRFVHYGAMVFVVLALPKEFVRKLPLFLLILGCAVVLFGFLQFFFYPSLRNLYYLGWDEHLYRMFGTFLDPNFLGAFFVMFSLFVSSQIKKRTYVLQAILLGTLIALFLTFSRSAYIMALVGFGVFLFQTGKKKLFAVFLGVFVLAVAAVVPFFGYENMNLFRVTSSLARIDNAKEAIFIFSHHPVFGIGFNSYRFAKAQYGFSPDSEFPTHSGSGVDNSFLFVLATAGIVGFAAFLYLWAQIIRNVHNSSKKMVKTVVIASILGLFVDSLFINSLFYSFTLLWMWIVIGLSLNTKESV